MSVVEPQSERKGDLLKLGYVETQVPIPASKIFPRSTYPYSGTNVTVSRLLACSRSSRMRSQARSKNSLSSLKMGFVGSGHCEAWVVPMRQWI